MTLDAIGWIVGGLLAAFGLYVLARALLADRSRGRRRCPRCWYDMDAVGGLRCPECGKQSRSDAALRRTRRHRRRAALALLLILCGGLTGVMPRLVRDPWGTLPTPVLSVVLWFYDDPSDTIFTNMTAALYAGKTTAFERLMLARYCARRLADPKYGQAPVQGLPVPPSGSGQPWSPISSGTRGQLLVVVRRLGREARPAIPVVIELSRDGREWSALDTLVQLWPGTPALRARVVECLGEGPGTQMSVLQSIARGPRPMDELIGPVLESVRREVNSTDSLGARTLASLGPAATPALRDLVAHRSEAVRSTVIAELGARKDAGSVPGITRALADPSWWVRSSAIVALHKIGAASRPALPDLRGLALREPKVTVRMQALVALVPVGGGDPRVVEALSAALGDAAPELRRAAASELASLGAAASAAEPALRRATHDGDENVALAAAAALEAIAKP